MLLVVCWYSLSYDDLYMTEFYINSDETEDNVLKQFKEYRFKQECINQEYSEEAFNENFIIIHKKYYNF